MIACLRAYYMASTLPSTFHELGGLNLTITLQVPYRFCFLAKETEKWGD